MEKQANTSATITPRRGPPKGSPKPEGSGRKRGTPNKRTKEAEAVMRPLVPGAKKRIRALVDSTDDGTALKAIQTILAYVYGKPVDKRELSGPKGGPVEKLTYSVPELARRVASLFDMATREAAEGDRGGLGESGAGVCGSVRSEIKNPPEKNEVRTPKIKKSPEFEPGYETKIHGIKLRLDPDGWRAFEGDTQLRWFRDAPQEDVFEWASLREAS